MNGSWPTLSTPVPAPVAAPRTKHDRTITIAKHDRAWSSHAGNATAGTRIRGMVELEGEALWDEDDVMLFCWGNSLAAIEHHCKKVEETTKCMERWRKGVLQGSV